MKVLLPHFEFQPSLLLSYPVNRCQLLNAAEVPLTSCLVPFFVKELGNQKRFTGGKNVVIKDHLVNPKVHVLPKNCAEK
jgi:hypothetical protein